MGYIMSVDESTTNRFSVETRQESVRVRWNMYEGESKPHIFTYGEASFEISYAALGILKRAMQDSPMLNARIEAASDESDRLEHPDPQEVLREQALSKLSEEERLALGLV